MSCVKFIKFSTVIFEITIVPLFSQIQLDFIQCILIHRMNLSRSLLTIMADAYNAGRTGGVTPEECYLDMLQKYGAKVDYLEVPAGALEILRRGYRLVHVVEILDNNRCTVKCTQGSSTFTTGEMKNLIDGIFDDLPF